MSAPLLQTLTSLQQRAQTQNLFPGGFDQAAYAAFTLIDRQGRQVLAVDANGVVSFPLSGITAASDTTITGTLAVSSTAAFAAAVTFAGELSPLTNDGAALGDATHNFSDLFLASGAVLNYANGNVVVTQTSGILTMGTGELRITTVGTNAASVGTIGSTSTLTNKTLTAPLYTDFTEVVTATNVITAAESGSTYFLNSATEFVSTLPAVAAGLHFTFICTAAPSGASYTVVTNSSANIIKGLQNSVAGDAGDSGTADDTITFVDGQAVAGDKVEVYCDGTNWFAYAISKVAAGITFTTAS